MAKRKALIHLTEQEIDELEELIHNPETPQRTAMRAKILLMSDDSCKEQLPLRQLAEKLGTSDTTVQTVRTEYQKLGFRGSLFPKDRIISMTSRRINETVRKRIVEMAGEEPPDGRKRWTIRLLRDEVIKRGLLEHISLETLMRILNEAGCRLKD